MHLPKDGNMSGRNIYEVYGLYNILSYIYVHLLVLIPYIIYNCIYMNTLLKLTQMHDEFGPRMAVYCHNKRPMSKNENILSGLY